MRFSFISMRKKMNYIWDNIISINNKSESITI